MIFKCKNLQSGFVYNGGLIFGSWAPLIAVSMLANAGDLLPYLLGFSLIIGSIIIIIGTKINPETRDVELS